MSDQNTSLPVRTEGDVDEKLQTKVIDPTTPAQGMSVDADGNAHVEVHGNAPDGSTDKTLRLSELGAPNGDGDYDAANNSKPASSGLVAHDENASPDETHQNVRVTGASNGTKHGVHVALLDEAAVPYSASNPLPVAPQENEGTEVHDFDTATAIAKDATSNHDYSVADGVRFTLYGVRASASGKFKVELQIGDGAASEVFTTKDVEFNSTASPNCPIDFFRVPIVVVGTANTTTIRVIKKNLDNQPQDLYSTIVGVEN